MKAWSHVVLVAGLTCVASLFVAVRHVTLASRLAADRQDREAEAEDEVATMQAGVDLIAEGQLVLAASQLQAELQAGRAIPDDWRLPDMRFMGANATPCEVRLVAREGDVFSLESVARTEDTDFTIGERRAYTASLQRRVKITASAVGEFEAR